MEVFPNYYTAANLFQFVLLIVRAGSDFCQFLQTGLHPVRITLRAKEEPSLKLYLWFWLQNTAPPRPFTEVFSSTTGGKIVQFSSRDLPYALFLAKSKFSDKQQWRQWWVCVFLITTSASSFPPIPLPQLLPSVT